MQGNTKLKLLLFISVAFLTNACKKSIQNIRELDKSISVKKEMWEEPRHQLVLSKNGIKVTDNPGKKAFSHYQVTEILESCRFGSIV